MTFELQFDVAVDIPSSFLGVVKDASERGFGEQV